MGTEKKIGAGKVIGGIVTTITLVSALTGIAINVFDIKDRLSNNGSDKNQAAIGNDFGNSENIINPSSSDMENMTSQKVTEEVTTAQKETEKTTTQEVTEESTTQEVTEEPTTQALKEKNFEFVKVYESNEYMWASVLTNDMMVFYIGSNGKLKCSNGNSIELSEISDKLEKDVYNHHYTLMYNSYDDVVYLWANNYLLEIDEDFNLKLIHEFEQKCMVSYGYEAVFSMIDDKHILTNYYGACIINTDTWEMDKICYVGSKPSSSNNYEEFRSINGQLYVMDIRQDNKVILLDESGNETESFVLKYDTGLMLKEVPIYSENDICHTNEGAYCFCNGKVYLFDGINEVVKYIGTYDDYIGGYFKTRGNDIYVQRGGNDIFIMK